MPAPCAETSMPPNSRIQPDELREELKDVRKDIAALGKEVVPALSVLTEQVRTLQSTSSNISSDMRQSATKTEMAALKVAVDLEMSRYFNQSIEGNETNSERIDNHDERLRDIEADNKEIKSLLSRLTTTVDKLEKSVTYIRDKMWWILGAGAGAFAIIEFLSHMKKG